MKGKLQIEQEQNKKNRREQMKEERRQMLVCDCYKELKILVGNKPFLPVLPIWFSSVKIIRRSLNNNVYSNVLIAKQQTTCSSLSSF